MVDETRIRERLLSLIVELDELIKDTGSEGFGDDRDGMLKDGFECFVNVYVNDADRAETVVMDWRSDDGVDIADLLRDPGQKPVGGNVTGFYCSPGLHRGSTVRADWFMTEPGALLSSGGSWACCTRHLGHALGDLVKKGRTRHLRVRHLRDEGWR